MPELPEVESIATRLREGCSDHPPLPGLLIQDAQVLWEGSIAAPQPQAFAERIRNQQIAQITRRGKYLILLLSRDALLIHLRMSGDIFILPKAAALPPHARVTLTLGNGMVFVFTDPRKFGRVWLVSQAEEVLSGLGPEPFDDSLTPERFHQHLRQKKRALKPLLLDQSFLAGLGNIYTDEALHLARLHPLTKANLLTIEEARRLLDSIRRVLTEGIQRNGASIDWVYRGGDFQNYFRVYQRAGEVCFVCGAPIQRIVVGQRGTHYCPNCQRHPDG